MSDFEKEMSNFHKIHLRIKSFSQKGLVISLLGLERAQLANTELSQFKGPNLLGCCCCIHFKAFKAKASLSIQSRAQFPSSAKGGKFSGLASKCTYRITISFLNSISSEIQSQIFPYPFKVVRYLNISNIYYECYI